MPYEKLNHRDKAAEKIPGGAGAFCNPAGYASIVVVPIYAIGCLIALPVHGIAKAVQKTRRKPRGKGDVDVEETEDSERRESSASSETLRPELNVVANVVSHPDDPRVRGRGCVGYRKPVCPAHGKRKA
jgi:hypothetical protein